MDKEFRDLKFNTVLMERYHNKRYHHYDRIHRLVTFFSLAVSLGVLGTLLSGVFEDYKFINTIMIGFVGALNLFDIAFKFSDKATDHQISSREYSKLFGSLKLISKINKTMLRNFEKDFSNCGKENISNGKAIIEAKAYNETCDTFEQPLEFKLYIYPHQNIFPNFITLPPSHLLKVGETTKKFRIIQHLIFWGMLLGIILITFFTSNPALY